MKKYILGIVIGFVLALPIANVFAIQLVAKPPSPGVPLVSPFSNIDTNSGSVELKNLKRENKDLKQQISLLKRQVAQKYICEKK